MGGDCGLARDVPAAKSQSGRQCVVAPGASGRCLRRPLRRGRKRDSCFRPSDGQSWVMRKGVIGELRVIAYDCPTVATSRRPPHTWEKSGVHGNAALPAGPRRRLLRAR